MQTLLYYGGGGGSARSRQDKKLSLLHRFTFDTANFVPYDLIAELDVSRNVPLSPLYQG